MDSGGNDIGQLGAGMSLEEMKVLADNTTECVGFNSNGWFKHTLMPREQWRRWTNDAAKGFYIKTKTEQTSVKDPLAAFVGAKTVNIEGTQASAMQFAQIGRTLGNPAIFL
jgi:hypothetical protein